MTGTKGERGLLFRVAELALLQALIRDGQGDLSAALESLGMALEISKPCGYTCLFDDGPALDKLLQYAVEKKIHAPYACQLLADFHSLRAGAKPLVPKAARGTPTWWTR